jgi:hypothetical protein
MQVLRWIVAADFRSLVAGTLRTAPTNLKSVVLASKSAIAHLINDMLEQGITSLLTSHRETQQ